MGTLQHLERITDEKNLLTACAGLVSIDDPSEKYCLIYISKYLLYVYAFN